MKLRYISLLFMAFLVANEAFSQGVGRVTGGDVNTITTAVPFLTIVPDSRHGAMGDAGAATSPDVFAVFWNPAKLAFIEEPTSFSLNYTPWLRNLVSDISLMSIMGSHRINDMSTIGGSLRYFTLGNIQFTDEFGNNTLQFRPNEWAIDGIYSRKLSERFSAGLALRFIYSNLTGGQTVQQAETKPGIAAAADVSFYYENNDLKISDNDVTFAMGAVISNIGNRISYSNLDRQDFLPMNLRIGPRLTFHLDDYNDLSFNFDVNKLLVPTPPKFDVDPNSATFRQIMAGQDPNRSVASAMFSSFYDAPGTLMFDESGNLLRDADGNAMVENGSVLREELRELYFGFGAEYWYNKLFAARLGYFAEHSAKGKRKFMTFGIGLKYNVLGLDFSYLIPFYIGQQRGIQNSPLQNTLRFSLTFDFVKAKSSSGGGKSDSSF